MIRKKDVGAGQGRLGRLRVVRIPGAVSVVLLCVDEDWGEGRGEGKQCQEGAGKQPDTRMCGRLAGCASSAKGTASVGSLKCLF